VLITTSLRASSRSRDQARATRPPGGSGAGPASGSGGRERTDRSVTVALWALLALGIGVALAPVAFAMFDRAPKGGDMIDEFRPYMNQAKIDQFRGYLDVIGDAADEARTTVDPAAAAALGIDRAAYDQRFVFVRGFEDAWPAIDADMTDMLDRMERNLDGYEGVDALPPFALFPWFFVLPGVIVAVGAGWALVARRRGRTGRGGLVLLVVVGVGLVIAPFAFQMFTRAPGGGEMIDDFRPIMSREKVTTVQGYFITIGTGEGELRTGVLPASGITRGSAPAVERLNAEWPRINGDLAPMVGVMADNLDNYAAVDALPPFALFPWFFLIPGLAVAVTAASLLVRTNTNTEPSEEDPWPVQ
jgi:hypothetical protein